MRSKDGENMGSHIGLPTANIDLVRRAFEALNRGELEACVQLMVPDFVANLPGVPQPMRGRDAWKQGAQEFRTAFPDLHVRIEDIFATGDRVAVRLSFRGVHRGSFHSIPATGRPIAFTSIEIYRVSDGRLAEEWVSPDMSTLMRQIAASSDAQPTDRATTH
jgi:steroid delta-isomerase-like uncharacterized protein